MNYNNLLKTISDKLGVLPEKPGVYLMKDSSGHIIYIGKAKDLSKRVSSYFRKGAHEAKVLAMAEKVADFDYYIAASEKDALGLEANLIKKHKPHYNILLKDNKQFPYIKIVAGKYPYLEITRKITKGGKYFGPYFNGIRAGDFLRTITDIFPVRSCTTMAKEPCLNYQIGSCPAPCAGKISVSDYAKVIEDIKKFLRGESDLGAREVLTNKMQNASDLQQYELAIRYRDGLRFLDKLKERTITQVGRDVNCDVFGYAGIAEIFAVSVITVRSGKLIGIQNFVNENKGIQTSDEMLSDFIAQYYLENPPPQEIVFDPQKGYKKKLYEMACENAKEYIETSIEEIKFKNQFTIGACEELAHSLGLVGTLKKIECYDISNLFGEETVASMVVFIDGRAERKLYRRFKIKSHTGIDDYKSIAEVLKRRLARLGDSDASFGTRPDLIIIDGGKGQLSSALEVIKDIPAISIAKQNEEIFTPNSPNPIVLPKRSYALRLVQRIRDEAHRFAITYHRKLRAGAKQNSSLQTGLKKT